MSYTCIQVHASESLLIPCAVAVSNVSFDPDTCTITAEGAGAESLEFSLDGTSWFGDGDKDAQFLGCFEPGNYTIQVRDANGILCVSDPFPFEITEQIVMYVGNKNDLAAGLAEDKEAAEILALQNAGYHVIYYNQGDFRNDFLDEASFLAVYPCVKAIYIGPEGKDMRNSNVLTFNIPLVLGGHKDLMQDLGGGIGLDADDDGSTPDDTITVINNTDPSGILNGFALGGVLISNEGKNLIWVEPTAAMTVLATLDGDPNMAVVWVLEAGEDYGNGLTTNCVIGLPFHQDHIKDLTADGITMIQQAITYAYSCANPC